MSNVTRAESMAGNWAADLHRTAALAAGGAGAPDHGLLDAWLALWALAGSGGSQAAADLPDLALALARRPLGTGEALAAGPEASGMPPEPAIQAAAALALRHAPLAGLAGLEAMRNTLANTINAAWRPAGRFAFSRQALPVAPTPFEEALAVTAWVALPDPVTERRAARASRTMAGLAQLAREGGEAAASAALWGAAGLQRATTALQGALPALQAAAQARLRARPPADPVELALLALALATTGTALLPGDRAGAEHCLRAAARLLDSDLPAALPPRAAALALAALPLLAQPAPPARPAALRPAVRSSPASDGG